MGQILIGIVVLREVKEEGSVESTTFFVEGADLCVIIVSEC